MNDVRVVLLRRMTHKDLDTIRRELVPVRFELRTIFLIALAGTSRKFHLGGGGGAGV
jgi:hypothetical protein